MNSCLAPALGRIFKLGDMILATLWSAT